MSIDPEIEALLGQLAALGLPAFADVEPRAMRQILLEIAAASPPGPEMAEVRDEIATAAGTQVPIRFYRPAGDARALILFLHGGGWTLGSIEESDVFVRVLAERLKCGVASVGYRLAPEHPFPAAVDDAVAAVRWASASSAALVGAGKPLLLMGDSAGANLAAVASLTARDAGGPAIAGQILLNPSTSGNIDDPHLSAFEPPFLGKGDIAFFYDQYIPAAERGDVRFAPLNAESLADLPPTMLLTAENDLLAWEGEAFARRLEAEGTSILARRYPGAVHSWLTLHPGLALSTQALGDIDDFVAGVLEGQMK